VGVTSSIRPIRRPDRARPRRADWAPGPGCLVRVPPVARSCEERKCQEWYKGKAGNGAYLDVEGGDTDFLALDGDVLRCQHGGVGLQARLAEFTRNQGSRTYRRLVSVGLDLHTTGDSGDGFLARQISDVDEGVVEAVEEILSAGASILWRWMDGWIQTVQAFPLFLVNSFLIPPSPSRILLPVERAHSRIPFFFFPVFPSACTIPISIHPIHPNPIRTRQRCGQHQRPIHLRTEDQR
jgi:hypothetical protein